MPNRLRISLVIPARNEERYLADCLRSALAQQLPFHEIIVVDNGSSDWTAETARHFDAKVISEVQPGIVFARDHGFDAATGDIIARIDADTILPANWTARVAEFYGDPKNSAKAWTSGGIFYDMPLPRLVSWTYRLLAFRINALLTGYPTLWGSSMALPRTVWKTVRQRTCERIDIHEDLDLATHLIQSGAGIAYEPSVLVRAQLRRVWEDRRGLWNYLQWWPRTLRLHGQHSWIICWLVGVVPLYVVTAVFALSDTLFGLRARIIERHTVQVPSALET